MLRDDWAYIRHKVDKIHDEQIKIRESLAALKVKASLWGLIAGSLPAFALLIYRFIK